MPNNLQETLSPHLLWAGHAQQLLAWAWPAPLGFDTQKMCSNSHWSRQQLADTMSQSRRWGYWLVGHVWQQAGTLPLPGVAAVGAWLGVGPVKSLPVAGPVHVGWLVDRHSQARPSLPGRPVGSLEESS